MSGLKGPLLFFRYMENLISIVKNHLSEGIMLLDLVHNPSKDFVKITIDSSSEVPVEETSRIAKRIRKDNNILSMFPNGCRLEVGTPGVGASLVEKFQYEKNIGRKIFLKFYNDDSNIVSDTFFLDNVEENSIKVIKSKKEYYIHFEKIILAKIKVSFV